MAQLKIHNIFLLNYYLNCPTRHVADHGDGDKDEDKYEDEVRRCY